ncbi:hypothetical protein N7495_001911 [Penicillium taxi]|uniref:uncharacterized protein n=1 Tax=Penicillium taxi TaxID=168475 RepID=UPI002544F20D|nr:uncharacterized protein N7495_001911 [Penicillium taxi]KAJ5909229.1 hypothetical protein N7495_001911 [Penicillium taxi]
MLTSSIPAFVYPPAIFIGLVLALWTWKCFWIIVMQNKLLYLSWLPPFTRSDQISEYAAECKPVQWEEIQIRSLDGTRLAICEGTVSANNINANEMQLRQKKSVLICYFQGNGGSTPLRLPLLSQILKTISKSSNSGDTDYKIAALSYRGYWKSSGRATQSGISLDAQAFLTWVSQTYSAPDTQLQIVLWGHSLGSTVAASALSTYLERLDAEKSTDHKKLAPISGIVMEAPISNVKEMLVSLYPQKWLPYRYLWPFSWNTWCSSTALERLAQWRDHHPQQTLEIKMNERSVPPILILSAEKDEVVEPYVASQLEKKGQNLGLDIIRKVVKGAMHTEAPIKHDGIKALTHFILNSSSR